MDPHLPRPPRGEARRAQAPGVGAGAGIDGQRGRGAISRGAALGRVLLCGLLLCGAAMSCATSVGCSRQPMRPPIPSDKITLEVAGKKLDVEVVFDDASRKVGLMFRSSLPENAGMLFIFPVTEVRSFWMRNTTIPLSIAFISDDGTIVEIKDMKPKDETSTLSKNKVRYALEVNQGWFHRAGVRVGDRFADFQEKVRGFPAR